MVLMIKDSAIYFNSLFFHSDSDHVLSTWMGILVCAFIIHFKWFDKDEKKESSRTLASLRDCDKQNQC